MPYTPTVWTDEVPATTPVKYKITDDTSGILANSAKIEVVTSITPGTSVCAANLNKLEEGVEDAMDAAEAAQADADAAQADADASIPKAFTATNQLAVGSGSGTMSLLSDPATVGKVLARGATALEWINGSPFVRVNVDAQSIAASTFTKILFTDEEKDQSGFYDSGVDAGKLTVPTNYGGWYSLSIRARTSGATAGKIFQIMAKVNGTDYVYDAATASLSDGSWRLIGSAPLFHLNAADYVEFYAYHNDTAARDYDVYVSLHRLSVEGA